uniref:Uncharacterized protein n=1 Tax=Nelumbo nucifera TaxID=4432 RepID=A0A822Z5V3_NELNU|nr:TPA_asm: hypothetical protein HUJ06_014303 [Nelumbo nucifera]
MATQNIDQGGGQLCFGPGLRAEVEKDEFKFINKQGRDSRMDEGSRRGSIASAEGKHLTVASNQENVEKTDILVIRRYVNESLVHVTECDNLPSFVETCKRRFFQEMPSLNVGARNLFPQKEQSI